MKSMNIYTPYTYLIGWSILDKWYYGVRFAKNCHPSDFWIDYFTSSIPVAKMRISDGEPNIIQIRRTFVDASSAIAWEAGVLKRLQVIGSERWLNAAIFGSTEHMFGGKIQRKLANRLLKEGTHNFQSSGWIKVECPVCHRIGQHAAMKRWHFSKCIPRPLKFVAKPKRIPKIYTGNHCKNIPKIYTGKHWNPLSHRNKTLHITS